MNYSETVSTEKIIEQVKNNDNEIQRLNEEVIYLQDNQRKQNKIIKGLEENIEIKNSVIEDLKQEFVLLKQKVNTISTNLTQKNQERIFQISRHLKK